MWHCFITHSVEILFMNISPIISQTDGFPPKCIWRYEVFIWIIPHICTIAASWITLHEILIVGQCRLLTADLLRDYDVSIVNPPIQSKSHNLVPLLHTAAICNQPDANTFSLQGIQRPHDILAKGNLRLMVTIDI